MTERVPLSKTESARLALIRYQLLAAAEQANLAPPLNALAINTVQDVAEALLHAAAEHLKIDLKGRSDFMSLFKSVSDDLPRPSNLAGYRSGMDAMNKARVSFKHHGNSPDTQTILRHLARTTEFAEVLSREAFGLEFDQISLLALVRNEPVRAQLEAAQNAHRADNLAEAAQSVAIAFEYLLRDRRDSGLTRGSGVFRTKPSFAPTRRDLEGLAPAQQGPARTSSAVNYRKLGAVVDWLEGIDKVLNVLTMGVDAVEYRFFDAHTPHVISVLNGETRTQHRSDAVYSGPAYNRCFKFVLDTALRFAETEFALDWRGLPIASVDGNAD